MALGLWAWGWLGLGFVIGRVSEFILVVGRLWESFRYRRIVYVYMLGFGG